MDEQEEFEFRLRHEQEQAQAKPTTQEPSALEQTGQFLKAATRFTPPAIALKIASKSSELLDKASYEAGGKVTDITGSPALGAGTNALIQAVPMMMGGGEAKAGSMALSEIGRMNPIKAATLKAAMEEGLGVPPSAAGGGFLAKRLESIGGKAATGQQMALKNQEAANRVASREAGLAEGEPISEASLAAAREKLSAPYRQVAAIDPEAKSSLEALKEARFEAQTYWKHYNVSADPKSLKEAKRLDAKAASLESYLDEIATNSGQPELVAQLRQARMALAKNFGVERALNVGSGDVDIKVFGRMLDKGAPLTGGLETLGRFAEAFPSYSRPAAGIPTPGVSKSEALSAAVLGIGGYGATQYGQGSPIGAAAGLLPLLSGPARGIALSRMMQQGVPVSGQLSRPVQGSMIPLSRLGQPEPGRY